MPIPIIIVLIISAFLVTVFFILEKKTYLTITSGIVMLALMTWLFVSLTQRQIIYEEYQVINITSNTGTYLQFIIKDNNMTNINRNFGIWVNTEKVKIGYKSEWSYGINYIQNNFVSIEPVKLNENKSKGE